MKVLVTGGSGFIGQHAIRSLACAGMDVVATRAHHSGPQARGVRWENADLMDRATVASLLRRERPTHLLHLAWRPVHSDVADSRDNLDWLIASLHLARDFVDAGGQRFVGMGSVNEYAWDAGVCSESSTPLTPATLYGASKGGLRCAIEGLARQAGIQFAWARLFFTYGPGEHDSRLVAYLIRSLLDGTPADMTSGEQIRDYVYAGDAADALRRLVDSDVQGAFNLASGQPIALREIANEICRQIDRFDLLRIGARVPRHFETPVVLGDPEKTAAALGWRATTPLTEGVRRTIEEARTLRSIRHKRSSRG